MQRKEVLNLNPAQKKAALQAVIDFFETERNEQIGVIAAEALLDFFMQTLGKAVYNQALDDAKDYFENKMADAAGEIYIAYIRMKNNRKPYDRPVKGRFFVEKQHSDIMHIRRKHV